MITPTQLIRQAALQTGQAESPRKIIKYTDIKYQTVSDKYCWLCGGHTEGQGRPISEAIKKTFMDYDRAQRRSSNSICRGCAFCLANRSLRNYSILATKTGLKHPGRDEWRTILFNPPEPPFLAILSVSGQKHLHFKAEIAQSQHQFPILLEEMPVIINEEILGPLTERVEFLYSNGFSKTEIETGHYKQHRILELGLEYWETAEDELRGHRPSGVLDVALFIAQEQDDFKIKKDEGEQYLIQKGGEDCITTSRQTKKRKQLRLF